LSPSKIITAALLLTVIMTGRAGAQCLSSVNPVGGSGNLLVLEKNSLRTITFFRYNYGNQYYEGSERSDFDLIQSAGYSYGGIVAGYGATDRITLETELGYYFNKTQVYNLDPDYKLSGSGFSSTVLSAKFGLLKDNARRFYISSSLGVKIPFTTSPIIRDGVELPLDLQTTTGAMGVVWQAFVVKEQPVSGIRWFLTERVEANARNRQDYRQGTSAFTSLFFSKHLMFPWLKGDWTAIMQLRNELRGRDQTGDLWRESTGSSVFYLSPQINYFIKEKWNLSLSADIPLWQKFTGTQLAMKYGFSLNLARDFALGKTSD
jgi:hypothetical protein